MNTTQSVKERPILFSAPMVRAILDGRKTQTRRVMNPKPEPPGDWAGLWYPTVPINIFGRATKAKHYANEDHFRRGVASDFSPYGQPGDRLWVRETWRYYGGEKSDNPKDIVCKESAEPIDRGPWKPSIFMPRWASRLTLEVVGVRVQRLQEISEEDAKAEGVTPKPFDPEGDCWTNGKHTTAYEFLWGEINGWNGRKSWGENPWVWVVEFRRLRTL